jgi:uracil-DNA glycosylase
VLADELGKLYFRRLEAFVAAERREHTVFPPEVDLFNAFRLTPYERVRVVLLGQDPYHDDGQAHGLAFSVRPGVKVPPFDQVRVVLLGDSPAGEGKHAHGLAYSVRPGAPLTPALTHLFRELRTDLGCWVPTTGCLAPWARQGVLLLNGVLTARDGDPDAHRDRGWEEFTDAVVGALGARAAPVVFLLCGPAARRKVSLIDPERHPVLTVPDPAGRTFLGSRPFSAVNNALELRGLSAVYWQLFRG